METLTVRSVAVWLDGLAPEKGTFAHALEWASRLGLPLRAAVVPPASRAKGLEAGAAPAEQLAACAAACARKGVPWDGSLWQDPPASKAGRLLRPQELAVVADALPPAQVAAAPVLLCPRAWQPASRVLVLHEPRESGDCFLEAAADVCRSLGVTPVVLTVARSESEAWEGQRVAEAIFRASGLAADFDLIAGCDVASAAAGAARWRRCSHVFLERRPLSPWQRWFQGDTMSRLRVLSAACALLVLPDRGRAVAAGTQGPTGTAARQLQPNEQAPNPSPR
jgi:hypothetical protein